MSGPRIQPSILDIAPYVPGLSSAPSDKRLVKLSSNETPLGTSPLAVEAYRGSSEFLHLYPDGSAKKLRAAIGDRYDLDPKRIVCGNGSDDLLYLLATAFAGTGDEVLLTKHAFAMYEIAARSVGATPVIAPARFLGSDVDSLLKHITPNTRMCYLANPNNPTGTFVPSGEVERLRDGLPDHVVLVIDAAYAEYVRREDYSDGIELVDRHDNVIVTRTFSKIYGLAALRLGWLYGPPEVIEALNRIRCPFNANGAAQAAGIAALSDTAFVEAAVTHNEKWRPWLEMELEAIGLVAHPSIGNFVLVEFERSSGRSAKEVYEYLLRNGVVGRELSGYNLEDYLRFTVGLEEDNRLLVGLLSEFLASANQ
tara:strand:- start:201 stop:1301 length:1101 start_codon:yes stop_codon:yes gene_type:complete